MSAWIEMIPESEATGVLREMYDKAQTPHGTVDNVMKAHSLRPHTMAGHVALYRSVLHHPDITLPLWFLEVVCVLYEHKEQLRIQPYPSLYECATPDEERTASRRHLFRTTRW